MDADGHLNTVDRDPVPGGIGSDDVVIRVVDVEKHFGHVRALRGVSLELRRGEILALIGDNGAGKSTLANVIAGVTPPDAGWIEFHGQRLEDATTGAVRNLGIETVYQNLALGLDLSIADNMFLGREVLRSGRFRSAFGVLDRTQMSDDAETALRRIGWDGPPSTTIVRELSGGQQQAVAVARAVVWAKSAVLLDEPTAALAVRQVQKMNEIIRSAAGRGQAVLVITHNIPNMLTYAHRVVVMSQGRVIAERPAADTGISELVELMVARDDTTE